MDDNQIEVPPSFMALYTTVSGRLIAPIELVRARYELCEDMAQLLSEQASSLLFKTGSSEQEVLSGLAAAVSRPDNGLEPGELPWVITRLAEVLGWEPLDPRLFENSNGA